MLQEPTAQEAERDYRIEKLVTWTALGLYTGIYCVAGAFHPDLFNRSLFLASGILFLRQQLLALVEAQHDVERARARDEW